MKSSITLDEGLEVERAVLNKVLMCATVALEVLKQNPKLLGADFIFVNSDTIRNLNREKRGKDEVTDVLSFPMLGLNAEQIAYKKDFLIDYDQEGERLLLGDVFICVQRAIEQAEEFGHSFEREICYLAVHGFLHLLGFDHETETDKNRMRAFEETVLKKCKLGRGVCA